MLDFDQIVDLALINNHMVCTVCSVTATFRHRGRDGRDACFRAIHVNGCSQARSHANAPSATPLTTPAAEIIAAPVPIPECIIVDFRQNLMLDRTELQTATIQRAQAIYQRTIVLPLRALHGELIVNDDLLRSQKIIVFPGREDCPVADTFVHFSDITDEHIGCYHGYYGIIQNARTHENALYLNSGRRNDMSALLDVQFIQNFYDRYNITSPNELDGAEMLLFGELSLSSHNKKLVLITDPSFCTLRLNR